MAFPTEKSHPGLRKLLLRHKKFFFDLYEKSAVWCKRRLKRASVSELRTLIRFLVCLEKGHVEIRAKNYTALLKSRRINKLINLRKKKAYYLKCSRDEKVQYLSQFGALYRYLLEPLFFERLIERK